MSPYLGMIANVSNPRIEEMQTVESVVQGPPQLHTDFEASLNYKRTCFYNQNKASSISICIPAWLETHNVVQHVIKLRVPPPASICSAEITMWATMASSSMLLM